MDISRIKDNINKDLSIDITFFDCLDSTNNYAIKQAKEKSLKNDTLIVANSQTSGKGSKGRSFYSSNNNGIYMSILLFPKTIYPELSFITPALAVSTTRALKKLYNVNLQIKWVNDIVYNNKKLAGILTEASLSNNDNGSSYIVAGIGLNVLNDERDFPDDIKDIASSLAIQFKDVKFVKEDIIAEIINQFYGIYHNLSDKSYLKDYKENSSVIGKKVTVHPLNNTEVYQAIAIDINDFFQLRVLKEDGTVLDLLSEEVTIRL